PNGNRHTLFDQSYTNDAGSLAAGQSRQRQATFILPEGSGGVGDILFTVTTDETNRVPEYFANGQPAEGNNTATLTRSSLLSPRPDLTVTDLTVTPLDPPDGPGLTSGAFVTVNWKDTNTGTGPTGLALPGATGPGLLGTYYDNLDFTGRSLSRTDGT